MNDTQAQLVYCIAIVAYLPRGTPKQQSTETCLHDGGKASKHVTRGAADTAVARNGLGAFLTFVARLAKIRILCVWHSTFFSAVLSPAANAAELFVRYTLRVSGTGRIQRPGRREA